MTHHIQYNQIVENKASKKSHSLGKNPTVFNWMGFFIPHEKNSNLIPALINNHQGHFDNEKHIRAKLHSTINNLL